MIFYVYVPYSAYYILSVVVHSFYKSSVKHFELRISGGVTARALGLILKPNTSKYCNVLLPSSMPTRMLKYPQHVSMCPYTQIDSKSSFASRAPKHAAPKLWLPKAADCLLVVPWGEACSHCHSDSQSWGCYQWNEQKQLSCLGWVDCDF